MAELTGSEIMAKCLKAEGVDDLFFIMGGPMLLAESMCINEGIRMIDVPPTSRRPRSRHRPIAGSSRSPASAWRPPAAAINLSTGLANPR